VLGFEAFTIVGGKTNRLAPCSDFFRLVPLSPGFSRVLQRGNSKGGMAGCGCGKNDIDEELSLALGY